MTSFHKHVDCSKVENWSLTLEIRRVKGLGVVMGQGVEACAAYVS